MGEAEIVSLDLFSMTTDRMGASPRRDEDGTILGHTLHGSDCTSKKGGNTPRATDKKSSVGSNSVIETIFPICC